MYVYVYMYNTCVYVYIYIYIYICAEELLVNSALKTLNLGLDCSLCCWVACPRLKQKECCSQTPVVSSAMLCPVFLRPRLPAIRRSESGIPRLRVSPFFCEPF